MSKHQAAILAPLPAFGRYLSFRTSSPELALARLHELSTSSAGQDLVVGVGASLVSALDASVPGMKAAPAFVGPENSIASGGADLWVWLRADSRDSLLSRAEALESQLAPAFERVETRDTFLHEGGRDLTGYEDGTENPTGLDALAAAFVQGEGPGLDGGSFVAVQTWSHDLATFHGFDPQRRDEMIGRRISDNEELEDAPESAHVKRTAQEDFEPEAFVLRRSMPWRDDGGEGLYFVAFGCSFYAFEAQMRRMIGDEDGIRDALFEFSSTPTTAYYWCPPVDESGALDFAQLGPATG